MEKKYYNVFDKRTKIFLCSGYRDLTEISNSCSYQEVPTPAYVDPELPDGWYLVVINKTKFVRRKIGDAGVDKEGEFRCKWKSYTVIAKLNGIEWMEDK